MSDSNLTILCWILGDQYEHVFGVKISRNEIVDALKDAIKAKRQNFLKDIDATSLILYKVTIPYTELAEHATALSGPKLKLGKELSEVFVNGLLREHVHVVVEIPSGAWVYVVCHRYANMFRSSTDAIS